MRKYGILCAGTLALLMSTTAAAQTTGGQPAGGQTTGGQKKGLGLLSWTPLGGRVFVNINGMMQPGEQTIERSADFDLYDERGSFKSTQVVKGSSLLDIGGGYRVLKNVGVGIAYTRFTTFGDANISGSIPHPLIYDKPRSYTATASDLIHKEQAIHLSAIFFVPFVEKVDFAVFAGPSFFNDVDQDFPIGITFTDNPPTFDTATINEIREGRGTGTTTGFNIGGEVTYAVTPMIGAGFTIRYTRADIDYDVGAIKSSLKAGNVQFGGGLRLRF